MSTSYSAGVILGVKLSEIGFNVEFVSVPYQVHDKKGNLTGKTDYENSWKVNFQDKDVSYEYDRLYCDVIEEIIDIKNPLVVFDNRGDDNSDIDKLIIGVDVVNRGYNDWNILKEIKIVDHSFEDKFELVKAELEKQFGVNVNPKLYFYFKVS
jgi:hypothetical protein